MFVGAALRADEPRTIRRRVALLDHCLHGASSYYRCLYPVAEIVLRSSCASKLANSHPTAAFDGGTTITRTMDRM